MDIFNYEDQIVMTITGVSYEEEEQNALRLVELLKQRKSTILIDFSHPVHAPMSLEDARLRSEFFKIHKPTFKERCIATALVLETGPMALLKKALLQALFVVIPPPFPLRVFSDTNKADAWLERMRRKG